MATTAAAIPSPSSHHNPVDMDSLRDSLTSTPAYSALRDKLATLLASQQPQDQNTELHSLLKSPSQSTTKPQGPTQMNPNALYLRVHLGRGSAFTSHLSNTRYTSKKEVYVLSLAFKGQRYVTPPVPCEVEPNFNSSFIFEIDKSSPRLSSDWTALTTNDNSTLHVVLLRQPALSSNLHPSYVNSSKELVATLTVDWRDALLYSDGKSYDVLETDVEGGGSGGGGVVFVSMEVVMSQVEGGLTVTSEDIKRSIKTTTTRETTNSRDFYLYSKDWWKSYQEISPSHAVRAGVKIYACDETGNHRSVCTFVSPVKVGRLIDSPRHASRFVALIPFERRAGIGGRRLECIKSWHAFLSECKGDVEDHCTLLCSLLLGFGLNAFVVVGTAYDDDNEGGECEHTWVCTIDKEGHVVFIESLTGQRYDKGIDRRSASKRNINNEDVPYQTVTCMFNEKTFYANKQITRGHISDIDYSLDNVKLWKAMDPEAIAIAPRPVQGFPTLVPSTIQSETASQVLEDELRFKIEQKRSDSFGLSVTWDEDLSYLLQPALSSYEAERLFGHTFGTTDFQQSVKNNVPDHHCFKGFPTCFSHMDSTKILAAIESSSLGGDILRAEGDCVNFAVRVKVVAYPENVCAVWVMLAVRYLPS